MSYRIMAMGWRLEDDRVEERGFLHLPSGRRVAVELERVDGLSVAAVLREPAETAPRVELLLVHAAGVHVRLEVVRAGRPLRIAVRLEDSPPMPWRVPARLRLTLLDALRPLPADLPVPAPAPALADPACCR